MGAERKQIKEFTDETELNFGQGNKRFNLFSRLDDFVTYLRTKITGGAALPYTSTTVFLKCDLSETESGSVVINDGLAIHPVMTRINTGKYNIAYDTGVLDTTKTTVFVGANYYYKDVIAVILADGTLQVEVIEGGVLIDTGEILAVEIRQYN